MALKISFQPLLVKPKQSSIAPPLFGLLSTAAAVRIGRGKNSVESVESLATLGSLEGINGN